MEHPKGFLFGQEEKKETCKKVEGLAVAYSRMMDGKGGENAAK